MLLQNQKFNFSDKLCDIQKKCLISNKKEFNHFFKSRSSDIVLLKLGNLHRDQMKYRLYFWDA